MHLIFVNPSLTDVKPPETATNSFSLIYAADEIISEIQNINRLLKEKNKIINQIAAIMNFKAYTRTKMSKAQIKQFVRFNRECLNNANKLSEIFNEMNFILRIDFASGFELHKKLSNISQRQKLAAKSLAELLDIGNNTILMLCRK